MTYKFDSLKKAQNWVNNKNSSLKKRKNYSPMFDGQYIIDGNSVFLNRQDENMFTGELESVDIFVGEIVSNIPVDDIPWDKIGKI